MLLSWLWSDTWLMTIPARLVDTAVCAVALWLASGWCHCTRRSFRMAGTVAALNGILGIGLYAVFVWVRDTGALPWRGPLWLVEVFLVVQTSLLFLLFLIAYRREGWRSIATALVTLFLTAAAEALLILLLSTLAPHVAGLPR
jgi:heme/copper-type cytochrome/quinol oxidase subunit 4